MAHLYIYSDLGTSGVALEAPDAYETLLAMFLRAQTEPLSVDRVANIVGGKPSEARRATVTIKVSKMSVLIQKGGESTFLRVHDDRKPGINKIGDYRSRPKPFMMDGSCRG